MINFYKPEIISINFFFKSLMLQYFSDHLVLQNECTFDSIKKLDISLIVAMVFLTAGTELRSFTTKFS